MTESKSVARNILVGIDGSDLSVMAEQTAMILTNKTHAAITLVHVVPRTLGLGEVEQASGIRPAITSEILDSLIQRGESIIAQAKQFFAQEEVSATTKMLRADDAAESILDYSRGDYDLIIIGARGENEKETVMLGSVAKKIVMHTTKPTMIIKRNTFLSKILVCVDGSTQSIKALQYTAELARKANSKVTVLNVQEKQLHLASAKAAEETGKRIIQNSLRAIPEEALEIEKKIEIGKPSDTIVETAEKGKHDLIVLGCRGLGTAKKFLLGSVSNDVSFKAKSSVLIVPSAD